MFCYVHYVVYGDGKRSHHIFSELYESIRDSGLLEKLTEIRVITVGNISNIKTDFSTYDKCVIRHHTNNIHEYEFPTLFALATDSVKLEKGTPILYLHLKGVTAGKSGDEWRKKMSNVIIRDHERCITSLADHNSCGTFFSDHIKFGDKIARHYSGNFWWSKSDHLSQLPIPVVDSLMKDYGFLVKGRVNKNNSSPRSHNHRYLAEFWIGLLDMEKDHRMCSL